MSAYNKKYFHFLTIKCAYSYVFGRYLLVIACRVILLDLGEGSSVCHLSKFYISTHSHNLRLHVYKLPHIAYMFSVYTMKQNGILFATKKKLFSFIDFLVKCAQI